MQFMYIYSSIEQCSCHNTFLVGFCLQTAGNTGHLSKVSEEVAVRIAKNAIVNYHITLSFDASPLRNPMLNIHISLETSHRPILYCYEKVKGEGSV